MKIPWLKRYNLLIFDEIDSTNLEAMRLIKANVSGNFVIWANKQTQGRGRYNKIWESKDGNLYLSLLLNVSLDFAQQAQLSFVTAMTIHDAILFLAKISRIKLNIQVKWPNDIIIDAKKISGMLLQSVFKQNYVVIGVGINVFTMPKNLDQPATSLLDQEIAVDDIGQVLNIFMHFFDKHYNQWLNYGFGPIKRKWLKKAYNLNKVITINDGNNRISGEFIGIDSAGSMQLKTACGKMYVISVGNIELHVKDSEYL